MNFIISCCLVFSLFFNPLLALERTFAEPLYFFKSIFKKSADLPTHVKPAQSYTIALVGDSMTQFLGDGGDLKNFLKEHYPDKEFNILNYGIGSTNILSVPQKLEKVSEQFDILILESFGNNPLSQFPLDQGLKKQTETLDQIIKILKNKNPKTVLIFTVTIAPSQKRYGEGVITLDDEQKKAWVKERIAYMKNHISYAELHKIPLINIYEKSLQNGDGNIDYLNGRDFIHPSPTGILFISSEIADFIYKNRVVPL